MWPLTRKYLVCCWSGHFYFTQMFPLTMLLLMVGSQQHWSIGKEKWLVLLNCLSHCSLIPSSLQSLLLWHDKKYFGLMCLVKTEKCITLICYGSVKKCTESFIPLPYKTHREKSVVAGSERTKLERSGKGNMPGFLVGSGMIMRRKGRTQQKQVIQ